MLVNKQTTSILRKIIQNEFIKFLKDAENPETSLMTDKFY